MARDPMQVYSATYSNVPVYEFVCTGNQVMRRRADDWINATHILKVADFDKPARTRILEREVQKGVHEKVQGGYGKYQGTWIPLVDGRALAEKNGVLDALLPIFDYTPGDRSPPPAPKHTTATSAKPRANRQPVAAARRAPVLTHIAEEFEQPFQNNTEVPDNVTIASEAFTDDFADYSQYTNPGTGRKRKRQADVVSKADEQHQLWAEELLDYFMLFQGNENFQSPPEPPQAINLDRPIDDKGHTALHWAAAMGDLAVVKDLIRRGASIDALSKNGETPLMRAVIFTNNFDKQTMEQLAGWLIQTVNFTEWFGSTVFHHIATTTSSKSKYACARYYLDSILNKMAEMCSPNEIEHVLNTQDRNGDTAITIAARNGARKCVRSLIGRNAAVDIANDLGETADELIVQLNHRRRDGRHRQLSSSPFQVDPAIAHPILNGNAHIAGLSSPVTDAHKSEAATALTTQFLPLLQSKSAKLASAFDAEIAEKEAEVAEAERVVRCRREEIESLKRQAMDLAMADRDDAHDEQLAAELAALVAEAEARVEDEQSEDLARLVRDAEIGALSNGDVMDVADDGNEELVRRLKEMQEERRRLVREVVRNQSLAGLGKRQSEYKRLITGALGVADQDVEGMLPEIVAELEDSLGLEGVVAA